MRDFLYFILIALLVVVQCETIFFTNSPSHLIGAKNVTSYKLLMKDSDPITIIEANKNDDPHSIHHHKKYNERNHASDRIDVNFDESLNNPKPEFHVNLLANMGGSQGVDVESTQNMHGALGFTVTGGPGGESNQNEFERRKSDLEAAADSSTTNGKKVVYSPILLKKFMAEYAEKLKNADHSVKSEIQKIHEKINKLQTADHEVGLAEILEFDKSIEAAEQKFNLNGYRGSYHSDRYKPPSHNADKDGWVTLDAVPWSSSSVSKWYPHGGSDDNRRRPGSRPQMGNNRFPPWHDDSNDNDDYYNRHKPSNIDRDGRPGVYSMWTKPTPMQTSHSVGDGHRPKPYKFSESSAFGSYNKFNDNDYDRERDHFTSGRKPWSSHAEIITDNRPTQFPTDVASYNDGIDRYHTSSRLHANNGYPDHQSESNGDWVLISTTKGYQYPPNRRQSGNRALLQSANAPPSSVIVNVAPQSMRMHKALRLSVLPAIEPGTNTTFSIDSKRKLATLHGGMVEIDATHETVEDDVRSTLQANQNGYESMKHKSLKGKSRLEERTA